MNNTKTKHYTFKSQVKTRYEPNSARCRCGPRLVDAGPGLGEILGTATRPIYLDSNTQEGGWMGKQHQRLDRHVTLRRERWI